MNTNPVLTYSHTASFKGFEFLFLTETTSSGKKTISHEYPNTDKRFVEEVGIIPKKIQMKKIMTLK